MGSARRTRDTGRQRVSVSRPGRTAASAQTFSHAFTIGRDDDNDVVVDHEEVSRHHAEVAPDGDGWVLRDLGSTNGTLLGGALVEEAALSGRVTVRLGELGPELVLTVEEARPREVARSRVERGSRPTRGAPASTEEARATGRRRRADSDRAPAPPPRRPPTPEPDRPRSVTRFLARHFEAGGAERDDDDSALVRAAFERLHRERSRRHRMLVAVVGVVALTLAAAAGHWYLRSRDAERIALDVFYDMKALELAMLRDVADAGGRALPPQALARFAEMQRKYDALVASTGALERYSSPVDRLIVEVARRFGECEVDVPPGFVAEVKQFIVQWQQSNALGQLLARAERSGYTAVIADELARHGLPPQFFFLALQESGFDPRAVGPATAFGFAKGMWQFIPSTGAQYGLTIGPLADRAAYDPADERFDFEKATRAAARYLADIYRTEAAASGLLVMAAYNWGDRRVRERIRALPDDPRERNFWAFTRAGPIPDETYRYVYRILAAAVIAEDPALFGFDFPPPLARHVGSAS